MSERKYRQRGYMDDDRDRQARPPRPRDPGAARQRERTPDAPRTPNLMATHEVIRCRHCATVISPPIGSTATCPKCRAALHSCVQCAHFDPAALYQCMQPVPRPVTPKDAANDCRWFSPSVRVERQTTSVREDDARTAFEKLFKF